MFPNGLEYMKLFLLRIKGFTLIFKKKFAEMINMDNHNNFIIFSSAKLINDKFAGRAH